MRDRILERGYGSGLKEQCGGDSMARKVARPESHREHLGGPSRMVYADGRQYKNVEGLQITFYRVGKRSLLSVCKATFSPCQNVALNLSRVMMTKCRTNSAKTSRAFLFLAHIFLQYFRQKSFLQMIKCPFLITFDQHKIKLSLSSKVCNALYVL